MLHSSDTVISDYITDSIIIYGYLFMLRRCPCACAFLRTILLRDVCALRPSPVLPMALPMVIGYAPHHVYWAHWLARMMRGQLVMVIPMVVAIPKSLHYYARDDDGASP
jgi:hypothetical protein